MEIARHRYPACMYPADVADVCYSVFPIGKSHDIQQLTATRVGGHDLTGDSIFQSKHNTFCLSGIE